MEPVGVSRPALPPGWDAYVYHRVTSKQKTHQYPFIYVVVNILSLHFLFLFCFVVWLYIVYSNEV